MFDSEDRKLFNVLTYLNPSSHLDLLKDNQSVFCRSLILERQQKILRNYHTVLNICLSLFLVNFVKQENDKIETLTKCKFHEICIYIHWLFGIYSY